MDVQQEDKKLTLRVKCKLQQNITMRDVRSSKKVEEFLRDLSNLTSIPHDQMALLSGFPPRRIPYDLSMTIDALGIKNQETIIVEFDKSGLTGCTKIVDPNTGNGSVAEESPSKSVLSPTAVQSSRVNENVTKDSDQPNSNEYPTDKTKSTEELSLSGRKSDVRLKNTPANTDLQTPGQSVGTYSTDYENLPLGATGVIIRKVVPSDNSCLFSAITFCMTGVLVSDGNSSAELRELIATTVLSDPVKYNEGYLGKFNLEYVEWISRFDSWGGGIELAILSEFYTVEINVMDTQYMRINRFGEDKDYHSRIFLIYDGIHYDSLYMETYDGFKVLTVFPTSDTSVYDQVMELGREANSTHQYTDVKNFTLRCEDCNSRFRGPTEAEEHAKVTGHQSFAEYK